MQFNRFLRKSSHHRSSGCFTLIELIVVIVIIAVLGAIVTPNAFKAIEKAKVSRAKADTVTLRGATNAYSADIGFFPPDVWRGDDPGFMQALPWNPDGKAGRPRIGDTSHLPANWQNIAQTFWEGPYMDKFPTITPWAGKYDYNYWPSGATRYGVNVPPGVYMGTQRNYADEERTRIPPGSEQLLVDDGFDGDGAVNGEAQLTLIAF